MLPIMIGMLSRLIIFFFFFVHMYLYEFGFPDLHYPIFAVSGKTEGRYQFFTLDWWCFDDTDAKLCLGSD